MAGIRAGLCLGAVLSRQFSLLARSQVPFVVWHLFCRTSLAFWHVRGLRRRRRAFYRRNSSQYVTCSWMRLMVIVCAAVRCHVPEHHVKAQMLPIRLSPSFRMGGVFICSSPRICYLRRLLDSAPVRREVILGRGKVSTTRK